MKSQLEVFRKSFGSEKATHDLHSVSRPYLRLYTENTQLVGLTNIYPGAAQQGLY